MKYNEEDKSIEEHFNNSLSRFVKDFACKNEVIAKFNNKKPISQIAKEITFPISEESIILMLWEHMIEKNIILLNPPNSIENQQYDFVKKEGRFGKVTFQQVKNNSIDANDYEVLDVEKLKHDRTLNDFERELIEKLPFKNQLYYVKKKVL
ncbi:MAG: hypothetical protein J6M39_07920 [Lachnospiraceae bacterium]|nr:hypothetical protein [Lachnospiraceae bacterium]